MNKIDVLLNSPDVPGWVSQAARYALLRDPAQALREAELLVEALRERAIDKYGLNV